jgi:hypothetical protein
VRHPLDIEIMDMVDHLKECGLCRKKFARLLGDSATGRRDIRERLESMATEEYLKRLPNYGDD